jgi:hypothetical protein
MVWIAILWPFPLPPARALTYKLVPSLLAHKPLCAANPLSLLPHKPLCAANPLA